ncbi:MAG: hypothetical protein ABI206_17725, partial [Antricoccus sp.]
MAVSVLRWIDRCAMGGWTSSRNGIWLIAEPPGHVRRQQGWKLHVSATVRSVLEVVDRIADVLIERRCLFKVAASLDDVAALTSTRCDRSAAGKIITIYPDDDEVCRELATVLDARTRGLTGPVIQSDRPVAQGSLVSYRYGVFWAASELNNDGSYEARLVRPDGIRVPDERRAWFDPPVWAVDPFEVADGTSADEPTAVLLGGRFRAHRAIRHANRGGVYRAVDTSTGNEVIIKHARRHVAEGVDGMDVRDLLRHEHTMLRRFDGTGVAPRLVELFEFDGDLFLAAEAIAGSSLQAWVMKDINQDRGLDPAIAKAMARRLIQLVATVERMGLVCCDLSPGNVMVMPDLG